MEHDGKDESGEMFSPDEVEEYMPHEDEIQFTVQGLTDVLTTVKSMLTEWPHPTEEYVLQLEVIMADWPG